MAHTSVLAIGIDPAFADFTAFPHLTPELVRNYIDAQIEQLQSKGFDCVVIGTGLREPPLRLPLFEKVINLVHALAPKARICFNTTPADTVEAVRRWVEP